MPNWKKVITSGSDATLNSLIVTSGITGSLFGTASWAENALTASYVNPLRQSVIITGSLLLTSSFISEVDYIDFNTGSITPTYKSGRVFWDDIDGCVNVYNAEADITLQVGQESWARAVNKTNAIITNGTAVKLVGAQGDIPKIVQAQSVQVSGSALGDNQIIGIATHTIEDNSIGYVTTQGLVRGLNTSAFSDGDLLFVSSSAGQLTNIIPIAPYEVIQVGVCVKSGPGTSGIIFVFPTQPLDFGDLSSAERGTYQYGDIWSYVQSGSVGVWRHGKQLSGSYGLTGSINLSGSLKLNGSFSSKTTRITSAAYTASINDYRIGVKYTDTGAVSIQLPLISSTGEIEYKFKDEDGNAGINAITLIASGSDLIDNSSTIVLQRNYIAVGIYNDGISNWYIE